MNKKSSVEIKGDSNLVNQIEKQFIYNLGNQDSYIPDEYAEKLLKEAVEDENHTYIMFIKTLSGHTIQCGLGRFSVGSSSVSNREMSYYEDALQKLENNDYISATNYKREVFNITRKGFDYYDNVISKKINN